MPYAYDDTIAAIASAPGGAARGVVRLSGPDTLERLARCFRVNRDEPSLTKSRGAHRVSGAIRVERNAGAPPMSVPGELFLWPSSRSYTRQPSAEFHAAGSPPLLAAVLQQICLNGVRPAEPGEFTLRAFLAGRIDLTQAEAVLGVIDARDRGDLDAALDQLAGGLSRPLHQLRGELLDALAELEAGLDFAEEDIEFISRETLRARLAKAQSVVAATLNQLASRDHRGELPRAALVGPPNAGKSSLFNALVRRYGAATSITAIVSPQPGATRDYLVARIELDGIFCELVDTAGEDATREDDALHLAAQHTTAAHRRNADVRLVCVEKGTQLIFQNELRPLFLLVATKIDLTDSESTDPAGGSGGGTVRCSSLTGAGIDELARLLRRKVLQLVEDGHGAGVTAATSARCAGSLRHAARAVAAALELTDSGGDELIAAEIRAALDGLGEVVGAVCADDVLDRVFSQFCIGK